MEPILGEALIPADAASAWAATRGAEYWFTRLALEYWLLFPEAGVRPEVGYAQFCLETGFGKFGRAVTREHHNPCGLKIPDPAGLSDSDANAHQRFPTWPAGIGAHRDHLALYAGAGGFPRTYTKTDKTRWTGATWDPRHFPYLHGRSSGGVIDLGGEGKWAPNPDYGQSILLNYLTPMLDYGRRP